MFLKQRLRCLGSVSTRSWEIHLRPIAVALVNHAQSVSLGEFGEQPRNEPFLILAWAMLIATGPDRRLELTEEILLSDAMSLVRRRNLTITDVRNRLPLYDSKHYGRSSILYIIVGTNQDGHVVTYPGTARIAKNRINTHRYRINAVKSGKKSKAKQIALYTLLAQDGWTHPFHTLGIFRSNAQKDVMYIIETMFIILFNALKLDFAPLNNFMCGRTVDMVRSMEPADFLAPIGVGIRCNLCLPVKNELTAKINDVAAVCHYCKRLNMPGLWRVIQTPGIAAQLIFVCMTYSKNPFRRSVDAAHVLRRTISDRAWAHHH